MKYGVVFPQTEFSSDPAAIKDYAQTVEGLGFNQVLAYDHILGANPNRPGGWQGPYTFKHSFHEPLVLYSFMAAVTTRIEFVTGVIILPQRQTALFAKQAATLDLLSAGRTRLGIGLGWNEVEYNALDQDFHTRGRRIEEQVEILRLLWTEELVNYSGRWHTIPDAGIRPLPIQRPIPLWFGGHAEAALRRAARLGDGWMPMYRSGSDAAPALDLIKTVLEENSRSLKVFGIEARLSFGAGNQADWQENVQGWQAAGATHMDFNTMGAGFDTPAQHLSALEDFARVVGLN